MATTTMKMDSLYQEMKEALRYFDLGFNDMKLVDVCIEGDRIIFEHGTKLVSIKVPK